MQTINMQKKSTKGRASSDVTKIDGSGKLTDDLAQYYSTMNSESKQHIAQQVLRRSYSSKVDAIIQHLMSMPHRAKSVIYSTWPDVLQVFDSALKENNIAAAQLGSRLSRSRLSAAGTLSQFMTDPACAVLLMSGKSQAAGLTLIHVTNLFLVEPVLSPAIEQQVVSRIHRIGQTRPTSVYQFAVSDTLEVTMLEHAVKRKLAETLQSSVVGRSLVDRSTASSGPAALPNHPATTATTTTPDDQQPSRDEAVLLFQGNYAQLELRDQLGV